MKQFTSHPNSAAVYVYRPDFPIGTGEWSDSVLWVNDRLIGSTLPRTYFRVDLRPGRQVLRGDGPDIGRFTLDTRSGEIYFVSLNVRAGTFTLRGGRRGSRQERAPALLFPDGELGTGTAATASLARGGRTKRVGLADTSTYLLMISMSAVTGRDYRLAS